MPSADPSSRTEVLEAYAATERALVRVRSLAHGLTPTERGTLETYEVEWGRLPSRYVVAAYPIGSLRSDAILVATSLRRALEALETRVRGRGVAPQSGGGSGSGGGGGDGWSLPGLPGIPSLPGFPAIPGGWLALLAILGILWIGGDRRG
jgi:hypothetical protein